MTDFRDPSPSDLCDWEDRPIRDRCKCGGDMARLCPGPRNCSIENPGPECRACGFPTQHRQDADDTWVCADCEPVDEEGDEA